MPWSVHGEGDVHARPVVILDVAESDIVSRRQGEHQVLRRSRVDILDLSHGIDRILVHLGSVFIQRELVSGQVRAHDHEFVRDDAVPLDHERHLARGQVRGAGVSENSVAETVTVSQGTIDRSAMPDASGTMDAATMDASGVPGRHGAAEVAGSSGPAPVR